MKKLLLLPLLSTLFLSGCIEQKKEIVVVQDDRPWSAVKLYQKAAPAVVTIIAAGEEGPLGQGSGFLLDGGYLVTNAHVVLIDGRRANSVWAEWSTGNRTEARILRTDLNSDLAVLKTTVPGDIQPLSLSSGRDVLPGEPVAAIGSPFGEGQSLSTGIISATGRSVQSLNDFAIEDAIQTDASINPGNSGGPLLDLEGRVIGINQQIQTRSGGNDGVGYAVPVSSLRLILETLKDGRPLEYAYLGVSIQELWPELAKRLGAPDGSLILSEIVAGGPADKAGLRGSIREDFFQGTPVRLGGDIIVRLGSKDISSSSDLQDVLWGARPGDKIDVTVLRDGQERVFEIELGKRPRG